MGIVDLNKVVRDRCPEARFGYPISSFRGYRVAVDAYLWLHANASVARREVLDRTDVGMTDPDEEEIRKIWLENLCRFLIRWERYGVGLIFVFDGVPIPEKLETRAKRREEKALARIRCEMMKNQIRALDPLQRTPGLVDELRKAMRGCGIVGREDLDCMEQLLQGVGIPCLRAKSDAEQLCAVLARERKVAAVFSKDTDSLAFGCPILIHEFDRENPQQVICTRLDLVLRGTGLSFQSFVDLCILLGCDFNTRIRGIGPVKAFTHIQQYRTLDHVPLEKETLKYERCREIFRVRPSDELLHIEDGSLFETPGEIVTEVTAVDPLDVRTTEARSRDTETVPEDPKIPLNVSNNLNVGGAPMLQSLGLGSYVPTLLELYRKLPTLQAGTPEDLNPIHPLGPRLIIIQSS